MPIATGVMLLTNVGLAIFNNWRGANNSKELQQKQREFQKAAQERNHERMKQLLREGQELNRKIEEELHQNRLENIERDFDNLINRIFAADDINTWPLKVLPMVMKNESLGTAFTHQEESVALHCILTPSNNSDFNKYVFPQLEREVEAFCNNNLTSLSSHPVIFYGGAWKSGTAPRGHEIDQLVADLPNLPMLLITPFFKPNNGGLTFHITTWGMCERQFMEIVPTTQFDYDYTEALEYTDDVVLNSVEQFSAYLESLIGYFADVYFWSAYNQVPITPLMINNSIISTDGLSSLILENKERYISLLDAQNQKMSLLFENKKKAFTLLSGAKPLFGDDSWNSVIYSQILKYCTCHYGGTDYKSLPDLSNLPYINGADIDFFKSCLKVSTDRLTNQWLNSVIETYGNTKSEVIKQPIFSMTIESISLDEILQFGLTHSNHKSEVFHIVNKPNENCVIVFFTRDNQVVFDEKEHTPLKIIYKAFINPISSLWEDNTFDVKVSKIQLIINKIKQL